MPRGYSPERVRASEGVEPVQALDGRPIGQRGAQTRRRLLDATAELLEARGALDIRVVNVARAAGTSPATYYQYFRDVEDAACVLSAEAGRDAGSLVELVNDAWYGEDGLQLVRNLVLGWFDFWEVHRAVLRVRNLLAQEGHQRFRDVRRQANQPFIDSLTALVERSQAAGRVAPEMSPVAAAAALMSLLERMATFRVELEDMGVDRDALVETTARMFHQTVIGS